MVPHSGDPFLCCIKVFSLLRCNLSILLLFLLSVHFSVLKFSFMFSASGFIVSDAIFSSLINFELTFLQVVRLSSSFSILFLDVQFSRHGFLK